MMYRASVIELNDLLAKVGLESSPVMVMRHRPTEHGLRAALPWLAAEEPDVYNAYQRIHGARVESALSKATHMASFIGHEPSSALFVGLYAMHGWEDLPATTWRERPDTRRLLDVGHRSPDRTTIRWFDLRPTEHFAAWKGRLVVSWPGIERSWWRWASRNVFAVTAIHEESVLVGRMPEWTELVLKWDQITLLPKSWRASLRQWRGVYLILDCSTGKSYVGSAYGADNIMARWEQYSNSGHGGNIELKNLDPKHFQFSILERVSPDLPPEEVIRVEASWKSRLGTRVCGLNRN